MYFSSPDPRAKEKAGSEQSMSLTKAKWESGKNWEYFLFQ